MVDCYVGLGGNFTDTLFAIENTVANLQSHPYIHNLVLSSIYRTSAVSPIPQADYFNAVSSFQTFLSLEELWSLLVHLETAQGKVPKAKDEPRLIDLDLLFYGPLVCMTPTLILPHPKWHERLFVLAPLAEVTDSVPIEENFSIKEFLARFSNPHQETISIYQKAKHAQIKN